MLLKKSDKIFLPKYFYSNKISEDFYIIGNPVNGEIEMVDEILLKALKILKQQDISLELFLLKMKKIFNIKELEKNLNKFYNKGILISSGNKELFKFKEEVIVECRYITIIKKL